MIFNWQKNSEGIKRMDIISMPLGFDYET